MNRWPGNGPTVSFGDNFSIKYKGFDVKANQNLDLPFLRSHALAEIFPNFTMPDGPKARISASLQSRAVEHVPVELVTDPLVESRSLEAPDVYDYTIGDKLTFQNDQLCWASHDTINYVIDDQIFRRLCVKSPILQLDAVNDQVMLMRTRLGLGVLHGDIVSPIFSGNTVDMARMDGQLAVSLDNCLLRFFDLTTGKQTNQKKFSKSTVGGFNRMAWGSSTQLFYIDHNDISLLDLRTGAQHTLRKSYTEHLMAVRDVVARENDVYVLESTSILWYDVRQPSSPVLEIPHSMKRNEPSLKLDFLGDTNKLLLSSHVAPFNTIISPGTCHKFPVLDQSPYVVELWPTIGVQSQISRDNNSNGSYDLWISSSAGGLFKQTIAPGSPPSSPSLGPTTPAQEYDTSVDFAFTEQPQNSKIKTLRKVAESFKHPAYKLPEPASGGAIFNALGFKDGNEFDEYNRSIWLDCVPTSIKETRQPYIEILKKDMGTFMADPQEMPEPEGIHSNVWEAVKDWETPSLVADQGSQTEPDSSMPEFGFTQPEPRNFAMSQTSRFPSSQPVSGAFAFSQPAPSKKKRKRTKTKDGFA